MVDNRKAMRKFIEENYNATFLPNAQIVDPAEQLLFKSDMLDGLDRLYALKDKYLNQPALIMGLGPSLLEIDKNEYPSHLKMTCNGFWKVPNFFDDFKPDFWCAANSFKDLKEPFKICLEKNIRTFVTIPRLNEYSELLKIAREDEKMNMVYPWLWEHQIFQNLLAQKYGLQKIYSRCNTITNHMIAFALWLGCNPINITGFDLSYKGALEATGMTHAGYSRSEVLDREPGTGEERSGPLPFDGKFKAIDAFDNPQERAQILGDLKYLCTLARYRGVRLNNLSYKTNRLPKVIA